MSSQTTYTPTMEVDNPEALPPGTPLLGGQYRIERYLSSGGFGITYYARDSLDRRVVIKECFPEAFCSRENKTVLARSRSHEGEFRSFVDMFVREAHAIAKLNHPNIVGVHQVFEDNETAYMALDLIEGQDLLDLIETGGGLDYPRAKDILMKVLDAIATVHAQDMLHRDISPDNILIDAWGNPCLIDFGAAREEASKKSRALSAVLVVKDGYSPQEFYIAGSQQTPCSDLYALAATFVHLITGAAPPNSQSRLAAIASNNPDPYRPLVGRVKGYARDFLEAIDTAMNVFPQDRLQTAEDWQIRIDDTKRNAAALADAQSDLEIEKTVTQLIIEAQADTAPPAASATETAGPRAEPATPKRVQPKRPVSPKRRQRAQPEPFDDPDTAEEKCAMYAINVSRPLPVVHRPQTAWIEVCKQKELAPLAARSTVRRRLAQVVICAALTFFVLDGHALRLAHSMTPLMQQVMGFSIKTVEASV